MSTSVIIWAVVWFVLSYALFATAFGALGSLASRSEDASSVTWPLTVAMVACYFVSFASIGSPDAVWARLASWLPVTAPFAMPNRIAMGAASWWDPRPGTSRPETGRPQLRRRSISLAIFSSVVSGV